MTDPHTLTPRELDRRLMEVLGWEYLPDVRSWHHPKTRAVYICNEPRSFSTDHAAAGELLDEADRRGWGYMLNSYPGGPKYAAFTKLRYGTFSAEAPTKERAVAEAFLAAALAASETGGEG